MIITTVAELKKKAFEMSAEISRLRAENEQKDHKIAELEAWERYALTYFILKEYCIHKDGICTSDDMECGPCFYAYITAKASKKVNTAKAAE